MGAAGPEQVAQLEVHDAAGNCPPVAQEGVRPLDVWQDSRLRPAGCKLSTDCRTVSLWDHVHVVVVALDTLLAVLSTRDLRHSGDDAGVGSFEMLDAAGGGRVNLIALGLVVSLHYHRRMQKAPIGWSCNASAGA